MTQNWLIPGIIALVILGIAGSAWLVRARVKIPGTFRIKKLSAEGIDPASEKIISWYDQELGQLGFEKAGDFEVADLEGENLHRVFVHPSDAVEAMVSVLMTGLRRVPHLEFYTKFQDRGSLSTDQATVPNYFEIPSERVIQRFPGLKPAPLYQVHQKKSREMIAQGARPLLLSKDAIFKFIEQDQQELLSYQVKRGYMTTDSENDLIRPTWKFSFYFIIRNLDPIPFGISPVKLISALLSSAAIMFSLFALAKWGNLEGILPGMALTPPQTAYAAGALGAVISGVLLGWVIQRRAFLWAGLIALIGVILLLNNLFPNDWMVILIAAQAGLVGNRLYESRLTRSPTRLPSQLMVLIVLIIIGWMMLSGVRS